MKIVDVIPTRPTTIKAVEIPDGMTFYGKIGNIHPRMLMVRAYDTCVGLDKPAAHFWYCRGGSTLVVEEYEPVEVEVRVLRRL